MRKEVVLITGANGEIGHGLIAHLGSKKNISIVAMTAENVLAGVAREKLPYCVNPEVYAQRK